MAQNDHRGIIPPSHPNSKSVLCLSGSTAILDIKLNSRISLRGETFISLAKRNTQQFVTSTVMRRSVTGDAGSLLRLHQFLMDFWLLNGGQIGETAPGDAVLRRLHSAGGALAGSKRKHSSAMAWTSDRIHSLEASVVKHVSKKTGGGSPDQVNLVVKWDAVASDNSVFSPILDGVHPDFLKAVVQASLQATNNIKDILRCSHGKCRRSKRGTDRVRNREYPHGHCRPMLTTPSESGTSVARVIGIGKEEYLYCKMSALVW